MNPPANLQARRLPPPRPSRAGFTLLEVLVSMGIIVAALAGIAALLPAAGSRLGEATETDRAATMVANARAELANRGLVTSALWPDGARVVVFGKGGIASLPSKTPLVVSAVPGAVDDRINDGSFFLPDEVTSTGGNAVVTGATRKICYGCMLSGTGASKPLPGEQVLVTTAVFRNPSPLVKVFTLTQTGSGSGAFTVTDDAGVATEVDRRQYLAGCTWVFAFGSGTCCWLPIAASWKTYLPGSTSGPPTGPTYVSLHSGSGALNNLLGSGTTMQAVGFDSLLRVDERRVTLE